MLLRIESTGRYTHHKQVKVVCYYIGKENWWLQSQNHHVCHIVKLLVCHWSQYSARYLDMKQICHILWCPLFRFHWDISSGHNCDWLIDYLRFYVPLKNISLIWRRHHCRWRAAKFRPMLGAQGLWAGRDLYRATPAVTRGLGFSGLIRRTATKLQTRK
jgi:hypothetical protein